MSDGMACPGCFTSARYQAMEFAKIAKQAKQYAIKNNTSVGVYKDAFDYFFIEMSKASEGNYNIIQILTPHE